MPVLTPTVLYARHLEGFAALVGSSAAFRSIVAAATEAEAMENAIHWPWAEDDDDQRPRAIIEPGNTYELTDHGEYEWCDFGNVLLSFEFLPSSAYQGESQQKDRMQEFINRWSTILDELKTNSGKDRTGLTITYPRVRNFKLVAGPDEVIPDNENGILFLGVTFEITW